MIASFHKFASGYHDTTMVLALTLWICVLPIVLVFTLPFWGWQGSVTAAGVTFLVMLALYRGVCFFPKISTEKIK